MGYQWQTLVGGTSGASAAEQTATCRSPTSQTCWPALAPP